MKLILLLYIATFFMPKAIYGQENLSSDSINTVLANASDSQKIELLLQLAHFSNTNLSKAKQCLGFAREAQNLAKQYNNLAAQTKGLKLEGVALGALGQNALGIERLLKSLELSEELQNDTLLAQGYLALGNLYKKNNELVNSILNAKKALAKFGLIKDSVRYNMVLNNLANSCFRSGDYNEALSYLLQALESYLANNDDKKLAKTYGELSLVYKGIENYPKAVYYVKKAINIQDKANQEFNLSISYLSAGNIYRRLKKYDSAFYFGKAALNISVKLKDTVGIGFAYLNIASVYFSKKEYNKAIGKYILAKNIFLEQHFLSKVLVCDNNLSLCYKEIGNTKLALLHANKAYKLAKEINNLPTLEAATETLYNTYKEIGNYKLALKFRDLQVLYKDSLYNEQKLEQFSKLENNYEIKSRDTAIELLNKDKQLAALKITESQRIRYFLIAIAILLLVLIAVIYNRLLFQKKVKLTLTEANVQLKELNASKDKFFAIIAHDLSNPLSAFNHLSSALIENYQQLSEEQLLTYLANLKKSSSELKHLLENLLQWALSQTNTLKVELREFDMLEVIEKNLNLLKQNANKKEVTLDFSNNHTCKVYGDKSTIDLAFRNILANAIKFSNKGGIVKVKAELLEEVMEISIEDQGIGMTTEEVAMLFDITKDTATIGSSKEKGSGLGLILSNEFIKKSNGRIRVISEVNKGSIFKIRIPSFYSQVA